MIAWDRRSGQSPLLPGPAHDRVRRALAEPAAPPRYLFAWGAAMARAVRALRRAFDGDVLACPRCGGRLRLMAKVEDPDAIQAIVAALGSQELAGRAPPSASSLAAIPAAATGA